MTDSVDRSNEPGVQWILAGVRHKCPECGETHELARPEALDWVMRMAGRR